MKIAQFLIFFGIVLLVYSAVNYYIFIRGYQAIPSGTVWKKVFLVVFLFLASSFVAGRILEKVWLSPVSDFFTWTGSFWLALMLYFFLIVLAVDLVRLVDHFTGFLPEINQNFKSRFLIASILTVFVIVAAGHINALTPQIRKLEITLPKKSERNSEMTIAFASDIHLGTIVGSRRAAGFANRVNALNPDLILLGGDILDEDLAPVLRLNIGDSLRKLKAPMGVIGITGNHEYIGGAEKAIKYLEEHGIMMLRDSSIVLPNDVVIIGREDRDMSRFEGKTRKKVSDLVNSAGSGLPTIMLDHQPFELDAKVKEGVDLTMSGHTHHGQMWPLSYVTKAIYEVSWGYAKRGNMHIYVSSGYGSWGPAVRIGNRPEIVFITLKFAG